MVRRSLNGPHCTPLVAWAVVKDAVQILTETQSCKGREQIELSSGRPQCLMSGVALLTPELKHFSHEAPPPPSHTSCGTTVPFSPTQNIGVPVA